MSKPAMPRSETPPLPTRRQLDELDALLQRMLELPVNHTAEAGLAPVDPSEEEDPPFNETSAWTSKWEEAKAPSELDLAPDAPPSQVIPAEWQSRWTLPAEATAPLSESPRVEFPPLPAEKAWRDQATPDSQSWERIVEPPATGLAEESSPEVSEPSLLHIRPPTFRIVLGWLGLLCLVSSLAVLAYDWFGWTW
jgi:hypothetical protein